MDAVSCPTTAFCVVIDAGGHEYHFNGSTWTAQVTIDSAGARKPPCALPAASA
jgi:hypothetical protein